MLTASMATPVLLLFRGGTHCCVMLFPEHALSNDLKPYSCQEGHYTYQLREIF